jgi:hypothetical protein
MAQNYDPKYDKDNVTLGYLKKVLGEENFKSNSIANKNVSLIKNYGSTPKVPYNKGDTWTTENKVYKCIESRLIGSFNMNDWVEIYDKETSTAIANNFQFLSSVELMESTDNKIETFYQSDDPSSNWSTMEKPAHIGDYYQNSNDFKTYIYVNENEIYHFKEKRVTTIIFDCISGHKNIFLSKPTSYNSGDIWRVNNTNDIVLFENVTLNDFLKANTSSTSFNKDHWDKITDELSLNANIYSSAGILISQGNILTNLQYVSSGQHNGYQLLGFNKYYGLMSDNVVNGLTKDYADLVIDVDIPDNFKMVSAYLTLFHTPVYWSIWDNDTGKQFDDWGSSQNLRLYKYQNENNFKLYMAFGNEYRYAVSSSDLLEIENAFRVTSYTPTNSSGVTIEKKSTINIKSTINQTGKTKLVVRCGDTIPTTDAELVKKTGMGRAIVNILGYISPK